MKRERRSKAYKSVLYSYFYGACLNHTARNIRVSKRRQKRLRVLIARDCGHWQRNYRFYIAGETRLKFGEIPLIGSGEGGSYATN